MSSHHLTNIEIQKYYQNKPKFDGFTSRNSLIKTKDGASVINLDEHKSTGTLWRALYVDCNNVKYFGSFRFEFIPNKKKLIGNTNIATNIYIIQAKGSINV